MDRKWSFLLYTGFVLFSCNTSRNPFFSKQTPHEKYSEQLTDAGLTKTSLGQKWINAATGSLQSPQKITLPYKEEGFFSKERPAATAFLFEGKRGENIILNIKAVPVTGVLLFADLWEPGQKPTLITAMDSLNSNFKYLVKRDQQIILRLQPELLQDVHYTLSITTGPSLAFPVSDQGDPQIISYWGAGRDNGTRTHEGVDIQAKFRTPALAAVHGRVRVTENRLGGKVVFLMDNNSGYSLYYAHLDSQLVQTGELVSRGDTLGLVGNTGNARSTVPHLHFGIYTISGAIDPINFIDRTRAEPVEITAAVSNLNTWMHTSGLVDVFMTPDRKTIKEKVLKNTVVLPEAAERNNYRVSFPDGSTAYLAASDVKPGSVRSEKLTSNAVVFASPDSTGPEKIILPPGTEILIKGNYQNYSLVEAKGVTGWALL